MNKTTLIKASLLLASIQCSSAAIVAGDVLRLDFGVNTLATGYTGITAATANTGSVTDIGGTGVNLSLATNSSSAFGNSGATNAALGYFDANVARDFIHIYDTSIAEKTITLTFSGLDSSLFYNLSLAQGEFSNAGQVNGQTLTADSQSVGYGNNTYVSLTGLSADSSGNLEIVLTSNSGAAAIASLSGLNLRAVPEPTSMSLLGLGGLALLARRKR